MCTSSSLVPSPQLIGRIFQQVIGDASSQLHSMGESMEDRSRNEGVCVPFVNGDEMYHACTSFASGTAHVTL